ncbi:MAG: DUF3817 domain-containing protein [Bacteroidetes bacterium]|nr:DUF3817 domain-containing protein [Bacteroidota bacterium]
MFKNNLNTLRLSGYMEGISFLILLGICVPLKHIWGISKPTFFVGMAHGILFIFYCTMVIVVKQEQKWNFEKTFFALLASILPFGTFVADAKLFKK